MIRAHLGALLLVAVLALCAPAAAAGAPRAVITAGPEAQTSATDATLAFSASGRGLLPWRFECRFDGGPWAACASPVTLTGLVAGPHGVDVRLIGLFADTTPATRAWTIIRDTVVTAPPLPVAPGAPPAGSTGCADAAASPRSASREQLERATLCLLNEQRTRRGLAPVRRSARLSGVARRYATTMVLGKFVSHTSPSGTTFADRIRASGYLSRRPWAVGEVIAWSERATPAGQVRALMASPPHRHVILTPTYRAAGVGVAVGSPRRGIDGSHAMVTVGNFGRRGPAQPTAGESASPTRVAK
ncbi:MAG: hypothetical protein QOG52_2526 [Frankiaceae bacterium]|nr:hypothetical protein [Frankiaceae bacterium]